MKTGLYLGQKANGFESVIGTQVEVIDGKLTGGIITETEAYNGEIDRASHAYGGRRTASWRCAATCLP